MQNRVETLLPQTLLLSMVIRHAAYLDYGPNRTRGMPVLSGRSSGTRAGPVNSGPNSGNQPLGPQFRKYSGVTCAGACGSIAQMPARLLDGWWFAGPQVGLKIHWWVQRLVFFFRKLQ